MAIFTAIGLYIAQAVGYLAASAGFAFSTAVTIGAYAGQIGTALAALAVSRALTPKISIPTPEVQAVINQTDAPRRVYVGKNLVGGVRAFFHPRDGVLHQVVVVAHGRIEAFDEMWVDGDPVARDAGGAITGGTTAGFASVQTRTGAGLGGNYAPMLSTFAGVWTADHRLEGQATFYAQMTAPSAEDFSKVFPKSYNTVFQFEIRGQRVRDPRSAETTYSDNAALVIRHYLTHPDGFRLTSAEVNDASISGMADVADIAVPQKAGGTAPNLRLWGHWTLDEEPAAVLNRMHGSCGIRAYEGQDGRIGLIGGPFGEPACTLTAKDIADIRTMSAVSEREGYNVLRPFFMSQAQKYELTEVEALRDEDRIAQEGEVSTEYQMTMCPNQSQAMRLAKMQMHDDNRAKVEIITNLVGLKARYPKQHGQRHTILLDYRPEDGSGRVIAGEYEVMDHEFDPVDLRCRIVLAKVDRASEAWTVAEEGELIVAPDAIGLSPPPPLVAVVTQRVITTEGDRRQASIVVTAVAIPGRHDLKIQAEYRLLEDVFGSWTRMTTSGLDAESAIISEGAIYKVRARWIGTFDGVDPWDDLGSLTILTNPNPPGAASDVFASASFPTYVNLTWRNPQTAFSSIRIYRHTSNSFGASTLIATVGGSVGQISEYTDKTTAPGTTYYYWIVAVNGSGIESDPSPAPAVTA